MAEKGKDLENQTQTQDQSTIEFDSTPTDHASGKPWGRCLSTNPKFEHVLLKEAKTSFGRRQGCDVQIQNQAISGLHCEIERDESHTVWVKDHSTNGTYVNGKKIGKGNKHVLMNGEEVTLIRTKEEKISYMFALEEQKTSAPGSVEADYTMVRELGQGAFALVKEAMNKKTGERYAVKIIDKKKFSMNHGTDRPNALMDEVSILKLVDHPNIIKIYDVRDTLSHLYIFLELVHGGDLFDQIVAYGRGYPEERARGIFVQLVEAIAYLHRHNIVHRDLKPENILLKEKNQDIIKISDFGLSRIVGENSFMKTFCGTPQYLAPEVIIERKGSDHGYDKAVDMWSLGVILYILLSGTQPFHENNPMPILEQVRLAQYNFPAKYWGAVSAEAKDLVCQLLTADPNRRLTTQKTLNHPWILKGRPPSAALPDDHKSMPAPQVPDAGVPKSPAAAATGPKANNNIPATAIKSPGPHGQKRKYEGSPQQAPVPPFHVVVQTPDNHSAAPINNKNNNGNNGTTLPNNFLTLPPNNHQQDNKSSPQVVGMNLSYSTASPSSSSSEPEDGPQTKRQRLSAPPTPPFVDPPVSPRR